MIASRIRCARPALVILTILQLGACGDASESPPARMQVELERELLLASQELEIANAALATAERDKAALADARSQDQRRLAELTVNGTRLAKDNHALGQHLAAARDQLLRSQNLNRALRRQNDQIARRLQELDKERRVLRTNLSRAYADIRRNQTQRAPVERRFADAHQRVAAAAREVEELRRYNGFLLQERGNLQAWLEEANATRAKQREALEHAKRESERARSTHSDAQAANRKLRTELERSRETLAALEESHDTLAKEIEPLRAAAQRAADAQGARAELDETREQLARLRIARDYLVEKVEACSAKPQPARGASLYPGALFVPVARISPVHLPQDRVQSAGWRGASAIERFRRERLIAVASETDDAPKTGRHERELRETREKLKTLERKHEALAKELAASQSECAAVKKQVQTLTWANEVLVKELDAAYGPREAGVPASLPDGTRGIYVLRKGESLSRVAKAFYGDAERWKDIVAANEAKIPDPDRVAAGTIILIPE